MSTLVLLLAGPMQSWGERAAFTTRDTLPHPSRSGIIGLLTCALGHDRSQSLDWARALTIHVRADNPGHVMSDYHTIGGGYPVERAMVTAEGKPRKNAHAQASGTISTRYYLTDAAFTVTVSGDDALIDRLAEALRHPRWPLFLGRKSCPPAHPVILGTTTAAGETVLHTLPAYTPALRRAKASVTPAAGLADVTDWVAAVADATGDEPGVDRVIFLDGVAPEDAYTVTRDTPVSYAHDRRTYLSRHVGQDLATVPAAGTGLTGWTTLRDALTNLT